MTYTRGISEVVNELCIAKSLLEGCLGPCQRLDYEPTLGDTPMTIDFLMEPPSSALIYFDGKAVHPQGCNAVLIGE